MLTRKVTNPPVYFCERGCILYLIDYYDASIKLYTKYGVQIFGVLVNPFTFLVHDAGALVSSQLMVSHGIL
ncbi:MAG TPA: hypothetical protein VD905_04745 [Flavobacteriales bacterium]|nr:hypothetical protein [Flavobacteriales bacterium]